MALHSIVQLREAQAHTLCFRPPPGLETCGPGPLISAPPGMKAKELDAFSETSECSTTVPASPPGELGQVLQASAALVFKPPLRLQLDEMLPEDTATESPPWPSLGSAAHGLGLCKPCDFEHRTKCRSGYKCQFCHLCPPGENRRRKKQKQAAAKLRQRMEAKGLEAPSVTELMAAMKLAEQADRN
mmetsp:Transcript_51177/g.122585  ORF Transcript_51177/g.122585 Transcript_51177/m.122585 type:complete len:186 (+) Transcript_51177:79-636(+)|eukprot:CAMPEP_0181489030 /NCGR_PEP_ID=MMETSP1110-20121109/48731_1 /TAXON_ID=174948 /ORGANISM="Symbiodinium sp., Strain CCMP421" /LENGTH=185 /DNA_ID=CAMNT_0023615769 /DNA_START=79 /DNA_END=636 /DNA_ORIENTATION=+